MARSTRQETARHQGWAQELLCIFVIRYIMSQRINEEREDLGCKSWAFHNSCLFHWKSVPGFQFKSIPLLIKNQ
jgi:hypothetical protein